MNHRRYDDKDNRTSPASKSLPAYFVKALVGKPFVALAFFILYLFIFRPGYQVDDDITMIQMVSGYFGGQPVPFMVFSNVILGFLLNFLYRLPTNLNWEILLFLRSIFFPFGALFILSSPSR